MLTPAEAHARLVAYARLVTGDAAAGPWQDQAHELLTLDGREWLLLDALARSWRWQDGGAPVSGTRGWLGREFNEPTGFVATITSWHVDGRLRQRATEMLCRLPGPLPSAALAVRALDHVPPVREAALSGLRSRTSPEDVTAVLTVLTAGAGRVHAAIALAVYGDVLLSLPDLDVVLADLSAASSRSVRRWAVRTRHTLGYLSVGDLLRLLTREPDQLIRAWTGEWIADAASPAQLQELLTARFVDGRLLALTRLPEEHLPDELLLPLLGDRAARVREAAQWRARRRGVDVAQWYRTGLQHETAGSGRLAACLSGLGGTGAGSDVPFVAGFLTHPSPAVRTAAIGAVVALGSASELRAELRALLLDTSPSVATAAAQALARAGAGDADAVEAWGSEQPWSRRAAWRISRSSGAWNRVVSDVRAATDLDPVLAGLGRAGLRNWLWAGAATTWARPDERGRQVLLTGLAESGLTSAEQQQVLFHAGLPHRQPPSPDRGRQAEPPPVLRRLRLLPRRR